ncbi:MAG: class I SAM-dependent methyltransferase [Candidatus Methanodesulfokora sp.]|jgi:tRNA (guanine37-N1)-methyltransferase|nr:MAG: hypothetical protein C0200_05860 [Candidatus Korarchaeota archaeon]
MRYSFDIIGSREKAVAIIKMNYEGDPEKIAEEIMERHKNVKAVLLEESPREGDTRLRKLRLIRGSEDTEVVHVEYGIRIKLDPRLVYFSPREGEERQRIARKVRPGEKVLVMFAGVGPYALAVAKRQPEAHVIGVEINEIAYRYFLENIRINKMEGRVEAMLGDVRDVCPKFFGMFDRVIMPLPLYAYHFLDIAIKSLKSSGGELHFYYWGGEDAFEKAEMLVKEEAERLGFSSTVLERRRVSSYSPRTWKVRVDFKLERKIQQ